MTTIIDLVGATIFGGLILLIIFNLNVYSSQVKHSSDSELVLQQNAKTLAEIINSDLRKIGFNYDSTAIITAESKKISFYADIDSNGVVDVVTYYLSDSTKASGTSNPKDKVLIRVVNNDSSSGPSLGITDIQFSYKNSIKVNTAAKDSIKYIEAEIWLETPELINDKYSFTYWELTINPRNI